MKNDRLTRRHALTAAGACLVAATFPTAVAAIPATIIPPKVTAFGPEAARMLETGSPAARQMAAWLAGATDEQLDWLTAVVEQHPAAQGGAA